jgi:hypothetical protein
LDIAAAGIVAMKGAVIAQLGIAAAEFAADQAAAVATFGVAEAALPALEYATSRIINGLLDQLEQDVLGHLLDKVLGPAVEEIERTVAKLSYQEASGALLGPEGTGGTKANTETCGCTPRRSIGKLRASAWVARSWCRSSLD